METIIKQNTILIRGKKFPHQCEIRIFGLDDYIKLKKIPPTVCCMIKIVKMSKQLEVFRNSGRIGCEMRIYKHQSKSEIVNVMRVEKPVALSKTSQRSTKNFDIRYVYGMVYLCNNTTLAPVLCVSFYTQKVEYIGILCTP